MPTPYQRIPVTNDPELTDALARVARHFPDTPTARVVHDLAVKGAQAVEQEQRDREAAIERLVAMSTTRAGLDWHVLERAREAAWGE